MDATDGKPPAEVVDISEMLHDVCPKRYVLLLFQKLQCLFNLSAVATGDN